MLLHIFNDSNIVTVSIRKVNYNGAVLLIQSHSITFHSAFFVSVIFQRAHLETFDAPSNLKISNNLLNHLISYPHSNLCI